MTQQDIEAKFNEVVNDKAFGKKSGLDRQIVYNFRHRKPPTLGTMLEVLYKMAAIKVVILPLEKEA